MRKQWIGTAVACLMAMPAAHAGNHVTVQGPHATLGGTGVSWQMSTQGTPSFWPRLWSLSVHDPGRRGAQHPDLTKVELTTPSAEPLAPAKPESSLASDGLNAPTMDALGKRGRLLSGRIPLAAVSGRGSYTYRFRTATQQPTAQGEKTNAGHLVTAVAVVGGEERRFSEGTGELASRDTALTPNACDSAHGGLDVVSRAGLHYGCDARATFGAGGWTAADAYTLPPSIGRVPVTLSVPFRQRGLGPATFELRSPLIAQGALTGAAIWRMEDRRRALDGDPLAVAAWTMSASEVQAQSLSGTAAVGVCADLGSQRTDYLPGAKTEGPLRHYHRSWPREKNLAPGPQHLFSDDERDDMQAFLFNERYDFTTLSPFSPSALYGPDILIRPGEWGRSWWYGPEDIGWQQHQAGKPLLWAPDGRAELPENPACPPDATVRPLVGGRIGDPITVLPEGEYVVEWTVRPENAEQVSWSVRGNTVRRPTSVDEIHLRIDQDTHSMDVYQARTVG